MSDHHGGEETRTVERRARPWRAPGNRTAQRYMPLDGQSVPELLRHLSSETVHLFRQELELAKAEMREKIETYQRGMVSIGIGAALLLAALLTALWTLNTGLTALLAQGMDLDVAIWLSPLILTIGLAAIGWSMIRAARERMKDEGLSPRRTTAALREDTRWAHEKMHEIKEEIRHGR